MDANWFDTLTTSVSRSGTRRRLIAALPLAGAVSVFLEEEATQGKGKRKKKCAKAGQTPNKGKRKGCCNGLTRDASGHCAAPAPAPTPVPCSGLKPTQSLQEVIDAAASGDTLTLCAGTWNLASTVRIDKELTLIGSGAGGTVLDGGNAVQVLEISAGAIVTLQDLTITNGNASFGGGIYNDATLTLSGVSVTGNLATADGGGIWNKAGTLLLQNGSRVTGNTGGRGGGISSYLDEATVTLQTGSSVTGNTTPDDGGGIYNQFGTVTLEDSSNVTDNTSGRGGGIYNEGGTLMLRTGSRVTGNTASDGGGIFAAGTVTLEGEDPSPIVVNNCQMNCGGPGAVDKCAVTPVSCS